MYAGGLVLAAAISYYMKKLMHKPSVHPSSSLATDPAATYDFEHQSVEIDVRLSFLSLFNLFSIYDFFSIIFNSFA